MRKSSSDNIYEIIKNDLLVGNIDFGDKVVEIDYANKLNVSRTPLREAIKKLEIEGIIERLPNGRLRIMEITTQKIEEIFEIRICLEAILFDSIVKNKNGIDRIYQNLILTKYLIDTQSWDEVRRLFLEYNLLVYSTSSLEFAVKILKHYDFIISALKTKSLKNEKRVLKAYSEHLEIITLLKEGSLEKAKEANRLHLLNAKEIVKKTIK
ncbi:GntR family transcriptional regulator [Cetobacterium sp.]|uniref:GntR family transcriptional regulator n=1 Tax=Cetobacterium sp. TaxID=2071632 RepID=UPI003EE6CD0B